MSTYEQRVEPPDRKWQYLLFAAEPIIYKILKMCLKSDSVDSMEQSPF
jgi:hypothetical protein